MHQVRGGDSPRPGFAAAFVKDRIVHGHDQRVGLGPGFLEPLGGFGQRVGPVQGVGESKAGSQRSSLDEVARWCLTRRSECVAPDRLAELTDELVVDLHCSADESPGRLERARNRNVLGASRFFYTHRIRRHVLTTQNQMGLI